MTEIYCVCLRRSPSLNVIVVVNSIFVIILIFQKLMFKKVMEYLSTKIYYFHEEGNHVISAIKRILEKLVHKERRRFIRLIKIYNLTYTIKQLS